MRNMKIIEILIISLMAAQNIIGQNQLFSNDKLKQIDSIYSSLNNPKIEGGFAIAIIENGNIIYKKAFGFADVENDVPFTTSTVCDYASIAKQLTGFAVAKLISEGLLSLEDDIRKYLPEMHDFGTPIKIKHLLGHTSGLRDWVPLIKLAGHDKGDVIKDSYLMKLISNQKELNFNPGEQHVYSNTGYFLLAHIVSNITGMPFKDWIEKTIFIPLGMKSTQIFDDPTKIVMNRASSYEEDNEGIYKNRANNLAAIGASSLFASIDDMAKWAINFQSKSVGDENLFALMQSPTYLNNGTEIPYNFGLEKGEWHGYKTISHGGSWGGFLSQITFFPEQNISTVFITNRDPSQVYVDEDVNHILFNTKHEEENESSVLVNEDKTEIDVSKSILENYVGDYVYKIDNADRLYYFAKVKITPDNFVLHTWPLASNNRLYAENEKSFFVVGADNYYEFICDVNGKSKAVKANIEGKEYLFKKITPFIQNKEKIKDLIGSYYSEEINTIYFVNIKEDRLVVQSLLNEDVPLSSVENDLYVSSKYWLREVKFIRGTANKVDGFLIQTDNGNITKNLKFNKVSNGL